jgi:hypothetical protein
LNGKKSISTVRSADFHCGTIGFPKVVSIWGCSSVGRASALQAEGRRFKSVQLHLPWPIGQGFFMHPPSEKTASGRSSTQGLNGPGQPRCGPGQPTPVPMKCLSMEQEPANPLATTGTSDRSTKEGSKGDTIRSGPSSPLELAPKSRPQIPPTPLHMAQTIEG